MTAAKPASSANLRDLRLDPQPVGVLGAVLSLGARRIQQLAKSGIVVRLGRGRYDLLASVGRYIGWLHDQLDEKDVALAADYQDSRARRENANAALAELELGERRGALLRRDAVVAAWQEIILMCKEKLRAIPSKAESQLGLTGQQRRRLLEVIDEALQELATDGLPPKRRASK